MSIYIYIDPQNQFQYIEIHSFSTKWHTFLQDQHPYPSDLKLEMMETWGSFRFFPMRTYLPWWRILGSTSEICAANPWNDTLPETNIAPEIDPGKGYSYWKPSFSGAMLVSGRVADSLPKNSATNRRFGNIILKIVQASYYICRWQVRFEKLVGDPHKS